jgi:signal transduction histidine kinase
MNFFNTFRGRLLLVLAVLLVATLGVQYYLNLQTERENAQRRERMEKALVAGITLGFNSMSSRDRLIKLKDSQTYFQEHAERVANVLVVDDEWQVYDSLDPALVPAENEDYVKLRDVKNLPPIEDAERFGIDRQNFPAQYSSGDAGETHALPVETEDGRWYVIIVLKHERGGAAQRAARPLLFTLVVLLASTIVAVFLVWRFTQPIANLSDAARRVAQGDLSVRVDGASRSDEMGKLAGRFNEMTAQLAAARDLEHQLRQAEKSAVVGRLGSAIAHEIRNPLNYINLTLDHLRAKFAPAENEKRETFERLTAQLKTEVERINRQITDFLRYSRPLTMHLLPVEIRKVVEDSMRIVEAQAAEQNIKIAVVERGEPIPSVLADTEYLRSVFNNLFVNGVQAMTEGGSLTATIEAENGRVRIEVADTGAGISPENLDKIFEPYFSTKETGTGLGLAIVKRVVEEHNGTISVASKLGEGTTFTVTLPKA